jgi:hypothetical protein
MPVYISKCLLNQLAMATYLDKILSFSLGDKRLKLRCCESVYQTSLRYNEEEDLGTGKNRQFVCLRREISKSFAKQMQGLARHMDVA